MHIADSKCEPASNYREVDNHPLWKARGEGRGGGGVREKKWVTFYPRQFTPGYFTPAVCVLRQFTKQLFTMRRFNRDILL